MRRSDRLVGFPSRQSVERFHEARLVRITHRGAAIGIDPFGMLDPQSLVNPLLELGIGVDLVVHGYYLVKDSSVARNDSDKGLGRIADEPWRRSWPCCWAEDFGNLPTDSRNPECDTA